MNLKGKQPGSTRGQIRSYMLAQDFGKRVTIEKIAGALGLDHADVIHNMSAMIRNGEPFFVIKKAKVWGRKPADEPEVKQSFAEAAGVRPEVVSESLTSTRRHDRLEVDVLNRTSKGSLIFQTDDGVVWIARKIEE